MAYEKLLSNPVCSWEPEGSSFRLALINGTLLLSLVSWRNMSERWDINSVFPAPDGAVTLTPVKTPT